MFTERSALVEDREPIRGHGVAVTPGRDGPLVLVAGDGEPNRLYARDGDRFADTACGIVADRTGHGMGACAADLDADGCEEVYVHNFARNVDGRDADLLLSRLEADRFRWTDVFARDVNGDRIDARAGRSVAALDRLGTGRYGVAVSGETAPLAFYELGDDGELTDMAEAVGLRVDGGCRSLLTVPYRSREGDLFAGVDGDPNRLFGNDGGHYGRIDAGPALADPAGDVRGAAVVDENATFALAVGNERAPNRLLRCAPDGEYADVAPAALRDIDSVRAVVAADFDNDGSEELFYNVSGAENRLFRAGRARRRIVSLGAGRRGRCGGARRLRNRRGRGRPRRRRRGGACRRPRRGRAPADDGVQRPGRGRRGVAPGAPDDAERRSGPRRGRQTGDDSGRPAADDRRRRRQSLPDRAGRALRARRRGAAARGRAVAGRPGAERRRPERGPGNNRSAPVS